MESNAKYILLLKITHIAYILLTCKTINIHALLIIVTQKITTKAKLHSHIIWSTPRIIFVLVLIMGSVCILLFQRQNQRSFIQSRLSPHDNKIILDFSAPNDHCAPLQKGEQKKLLHVAAGVAGFYNKYNTWFSKKWQCLTGQSVTIEQLSGASGDFKRSVIKGEMSPDIITMSNPAEMDEIAEQTNSVPTSWRNSFPYDSSPYYSAVIFMVQKGNPKHIKDWKDLTSPNITIAVSNPKTCGGGRWVYTGALGYGKYISDATHDRTTEYLTQFYANVPKLYNNQGESGDAFTKNNERDVLITYEKFVLGTLPNNKNIEMIVPPRTIMIEIPIAIAVHNTDQRHTTEIANAYVAGLYDPEVQRLIAEDYLRPRITTRATDLLSRFPAIKLFKNEDVFDSKKNTQKMHLQDGGVFDRLLQ